MLQAPDFLQTDANITVSTSVNLSSQNILAVFPCSLASRAAITKYHRLGSLNNRNLFLPVWHTKKSKVKAVKPGVC